MSKHFLICSGHRPHKEIESGQLSCLLLLIQEGFSQPPVESALMGFMGIMGGSQ